MWRLQVPPPLRASTYGYALFCSETTPIFHFGQLTFPKPSPNPRIIMRRTEYLFHYQNASARKKESWGGEIFVNSSCASFEKPDGTIHNLVGPGRSQMHMLLYRPLYGTRDAPLRWFHRLASALVSAGFATLKNDSCVFMRHRKLNEGENGFVWNTKYTPTSIIMIHVGDVIFSGSATDFRMLQSCLSQFKHGAWEERTPAYSITFCGITVQLNESRCVELSQREFYSKIRPLARSGIISKGVLVISRRALQKKIKSFLGSRLWVAQTRFDISFLVCWSGSEVPDALSSTSELKLFLSVAAKLHSGITSLDYPLRFAPVDFKTSYGRFPQLFTFTDASFGTLRGRGSIEARISIWGVPVERDGIVHCVGNLVCRYERRIPRVRRSTAQSELIALSNAGELSLYLQIILSEILTWGV